MLQDRGVAEMDNNSRGKCLSTLHQITVVKSILRFMLFVLVQVLIILVFVDLELSLGIDGVIKNIDQTGVKI